MKKKNNKDDIYIVLFIIMVIYHFRTRLIFFTKDIDDPILNKITEMFSSFSANCDKITEMVSSFVVQCSQHPGFLPVMVYFFVNLFGVCGLSLDTEFNEKKYSLNRYFLLIFTYINLLVFLVLCIKNSTAIHQSGWDRDLIITLVFMVALLILRLLFSDGWMWMLGLKKVHPYLYVFADWLFHVTCTIVLYSLIIFIIEYFK